MREIKEQKVILIFLVEIISNYYQNFQENEETEGPDGFEISMPDVILKNNFSVQTFSICP